MPNFLLQPNLPEKQVNTVIMSGAYSEFVQAIQELQIKTIHTIKNNNLIDGLSEHADLLYNQPSKDTLVYDYSQRDNIVNYLTIGENKKLITVKSVKTPYPGDCLLNCCVVGNNVFLNTATCCNELLEIYKNNTYNIINVKQGYCKCSISVVNNNAIITDDPSIGHAAAANGIDCIEVTKGSIKLSGFNYGFIGGCSGKINSNQLAFCGDISYHNDYDKIKRFLYKYDVEPISLIKNCPLEDIGGIMPIAE